MLRRRPLAACFGLALALALCLLGLWTARSQTGGLRRVTVTTEEGISVNPSLSGDGRRISFESTEDVAHAGGADFFRAIRADLSSDPAAFVQMGAARAPAAGISQDGSIIAFAARENPLGTNPDGNSEIFLYNGATLRQITNTTPNDISRRTQDGNFSPSLTDDGRFIAFSSNRNLAGQNADGNLEIYVFDTSTNTFAQLTNTASTVGASDAKISGDGSRVAYIRDNNALPSVQRDLVLQTRTGGVVRILAASVTNLAMTYGRAISDDGQRVVYSGDVAENSSQVFLFDGRTTSTSRQITALGARETEVPLHATISGDGQRISFATRRPIASAGSNSDNSIELYTYDIPTGQFARVTSAPSNADCFSGSTRVCEVVSSLNDDGSVVAFNFPRSLSGTVTTGLENNSEIYVTGTAARPTTGALTILNGASFGHEPSTTEAVAPDSISVALGGALSFTTEQAQKQQDGTFPTTVGGTTVTVNGRRAQIFYVSPSQVNFLVPAQTELGTAEVIVTNSEGFQSKGTVTVLRAAPGIFTYSGDGQGEGVVLDAQTLTPGPFDPTNGNLRLIIFSTGVRNATTVTATAGGRALTVESVIASPDMPGMDEVRVLVPSDLRGAGPVNVVLRADNRDSNPVIITFSGNACRDIVINEVLADPPDGIAGDANRDGVRNGTEDEFVELVNTTASDIDISGYQLLTRSSTTTTDTVRFTFAPGTLFPARSAIVIFGGGNFNPLNPAFGGAQVFKATSSAGLSLTNTGGVVTLRTPSQTIVNIFTYGGSTGLDGDANQSLTRSPDAGDGTCGNFVLHSTAQNSGGRLFSPGTRADGSFFATGLGRLTSVTISPPSASVTRGQTTQFTAQARDQFNRPMIGVTITFASDNTSVANVDSVSTDPTTGIATATVTGRSAGTAHITAQATDGTTTVTSSPATLTVNEPPPVVTRVEVSPSNATINRGQTQQFTATAFDENNQPIVGASFTWSSNNTNVATVNANGLATGVGLGSVTITATTSDATGATIAGTATLNVQVPLVINEINADVAADNTSTLAVEGDANRDGVRDSDDDEFVELLNNSSAPVDISGVIIADGTSNRFTVPANTTLAAGRALVVFGGGTLNASDPTFGGALVLAVSGSGTLSLNDTGDTVTVKLNVGGSDVQIAQVVYGGTGNPPAPSDQSLTRSPDAEVGTTGGGFVQHTSATNAAGRTFSPGTRADGTPFGSPAITRIEVTPPSAAKDVNGTQTFTARAFSNVGGIESEVQNVSFIWDSSDTSKATVAPLTGQSTTATAVSPGTATIRARAGGQQGSATFTINQSQPVLTSVTIQPASATINVGDTQQFTAQALDQFGNPIGGVTITFTSNNTTVATVDSVSPTSATGSATATVTAHANGTAEIRAQATDGTTTVTSSPATLTVAQVVSAGQLVISEFRTRGPAGASDEFVEIYNPTTSSILIGGLKIRASNSSGTVSDRVTITAGTTLGPGCHYLVANTAYTGSVTPNQTYGTGIADDGGIAITRADGTTVIDQVGMSSGSAFKEGTTLAPLTLNVEQSYERKPGGASGNGTDTNNNAADFFLNASSSNPQNSSSGCLDLTTADLGITKTDSPDPVTTGMDVTYTITVTNAGPGTAQSVVVTDNLPGNVTFVSCGSTGGGVCGGTGNNRTVTFSSLASGASATITLVATANGAAGSTITNTATVSSSTTDSNSANNSATATTNVQGTLPTLSINDVTQAEGNSGTTTFTFTVSLSAVAPAGGVTFDIATADGTATAGSDYVARSLTSQTIAAGQQTYTFDVTVNGDTAVESNETFFVNVTNVVNATVGDGQGLGTITNDDGASLIISQLYQAGGNSGAAYTNDFVEIFNRGTTTINFAVTPYSIQYVGTTGSFGSTSASNKTDITSGTIAPGQYFLVQEASGGAVGSALPTPDATGSINMSATSGKVALVVGTAALPAATCPGDDGSVPFNPNNSGIADFVGYGSTNTATGQCYEGTGPAPAPSNTTADIRKAGGCTDTNDNAADFFVATPAPRNTSSPLNSCSAGVAPTLSINDVTQSEGNSGTTTFTFTVSLSAPAPSTDVTFDIATANGTATAGSDYVAKSLTSQIIPAGQQTYSFSVTVNGDATIEPDETFFVNVTNVVGATVADGQGQGTIQNDELPSLSINDVSQNEGDSGTTTFTFTVSLSAPAPTGGVTFDIATADNTATVADNDYVARSLTGQTIPAGQQTYTFDVTVNGDIKIELAETFFVNVTNVTGATVADGQGLGTILADESLMISINDVTRAEGDSGTSTFTFTVSLSQPAPAGGVTFDIATQDGSAVAGSDYVARSLTAQTIPAGQQTYTFDVTVNGDTLVEPNESFFVNVTNISGAIVADNQGTGTLQNDDAALLVISQVYGGGGNASAPYLNDFVEIFNRGTTTINFAITPYSIQYAGATSAFGAANTKTDITSGTIAPGQYFLVQEASGGAVGVALPTPDATGNISLAATAGKVALVTGTAALSATSCPGDDGVSPFNPNVSTIADFVGYGTTASCYEGTGPAPAPSNTTADLRKSGGCTDTNDNASDFQTGAPTPRNTSSPTNNCGAPPTPTLSINDVAAAEGNTGATNTFTFTVSLSSPAPAGGVTFDISTADGTATVADNDYVAHSLTGQTIPAAQQTYTFNVTINGDNKVEPDETFFVNVTNVVGANVTDGQGQGTIQNDDAAALPTLSINDVTANEGNSGTTTFTFTVSLSAAAPAGGVTFNIATADNTATVADNDYVAKSLTSQSIAAGNQTYTFDVTVNGDTAVEANETFFVNVTSVTNATISDGQGTGTITNDDSAAPALPAAGQVIINEALVASSTSATTRPDFLELYNTTNQTLDISGMVISFRPGGAGNTPSTVTLPGAVGSGTTTIAANSYFIIVNGPSVLSGSGATVAADYNPGAGNFDLNGTGGGIKIEVNGVKLDGLTYQGSATAINATFVAYGEGSIFTFTSATTNDLVRSSTSTDTNNNASDFRHLSSTTTITPKAANPP